jgi:Pentapeptide repeats (8 copies)
MRLAPSNTPDSRGERARWNVLFDNLSERLQEMPIYEILHRWNAKLIALVEAETYPQALELAVTRGVRMVYADLRGVKVSGIPLIKGDFRGAELSHAELVGGNLEKADLRAARLIETDLRQAILRTADLRQADLRGADLRYASLEGAQLVGADLRNALLTGARLEQAALDWRWSPIVVELLRQDGLGSTAASKIMAELAFQEDLRPYDWLKVLIRQGSQASAALRVFARHIRPGDNAPELLRSLAADLPAGYLPAGSAEEVAVPLASSPLLWTRRAGRNRPAILQKD